MTDDPIGHKYGFFFPVPFLLVHIFNTRTSTASHHSDLSFLSTFIPSGQTGELHSMALSSLYSKKRSLPIKAFYFLLSFYRGISSSDAFLCNGASLRFPNAYHHHHQGAFVKEDHDVQRSTMRMEASFLSSTSTCNKGLHHGGLQSGWKYHHQLQTIRHHPTRTFSSSLVLQMGKPKRGSIVDSYQTVSVNCAKCRTRLFRYKKKNGTKSNLIKCYIERISEDCVGLVSQKQEMKENNPTTSTDTDWVCPNCKSKFGRDSMIHGRPAIKLAGRKTQMTKK